MSIKLGNTLIEPLANSPGIITVGISGDMRASGVSISQLLAVSGDTMEGTLSFSGAGIQTDINFVPTWGEGKVFYDINQHTLAYYNDNPDVTVNLGQEVLIRARNNTGSTILNGKVVVISGALGSVPLLQLADCATISSHYVIGVATHDIADNETGYATVIGKVNGLNTNSYSNEGIILWLGNNGDLTETEPTPPNHRIKVGYLVRKHGTQGAILVNIDKGADLGDLHNVLITSPVDGDILVKSGNVWSNSANITAISASLQSQINSINSNYYIPLTSSVVLTRTTSAMTIEQQIDSGTVYAWSTPQTGDVINILNNTASETSCYINGNGHNIEGTTTFELIFGEAFSFRYNGTEWKAF